MQFSVSMITLLTTIFGAAGFCTTLCMLGIYIGSFNSKFATLSHHEELENSLNTLKLEFVRLKTEVKGLKDSKK